MSISKLEAKCTLTLSPPGLYEKLRMPMNSDIKHCQHQQHESSVKKSKSKSETKSPKKESEISSFCGWDGETLVLNVLGTPSAKKDAIGKPKGKQLKISVTAAPVAGKATDHMVKFLAGEFGVSPGDITVVFGRFNVNKQLRIKSPKTLPAVIAKELAE